VNRGLSSCLLTGLLAGDDDTIAAALLDLPSAQRVRLARLLSAAMEDAIIRHGRQDPAAPVMIMTGETPAIVPGVLRDAGLRVPGKSNAAGAWLVQFLRDGRQP